MYFLPFLPLEDFHEIFVNLISNLDESVVDFATYIKSTYVDKQNVVGDNCYLNSLQKLWNNINLYEAEDREKFHRMFPFKLKKVLLL